MISIHLSYSRTSRDRGGKENSKLVNSSRVLVPFSQVWRIRGCHCFRVLKYSAMSALNITAARSPCCPTTAHHNYAGEYSFAYFVLSGAAFATGISNRARRRERPAAYSNGISLGSFNHWHYSNPDNCRCSGHRRLPRVYYEYNEPRSTWACSLKGERDHLKSRKNPRSDRYHFFRASRPSHSRSIRGPEFFILKWTYEPHTPSDSLDG